MIMVHLLTLNSHILRAGKSYGWFSYIVYAYNFLKYFGLHTADSVDTWLGKLVKHKMGDEDATFYQVCKQTVTNKNIFTFNKNSFIFIKYCKAQNKI